MNKQKLVTVIMGQNCERFIKMCLKSVKDSDAIVYCDGGSIDITLDFIREEYPEVKRIYNPYNQEDKKMNGKQRNFYLDYIKKKYQNYWCLCIDVDEVVEDLSKIKEFINTIQSEAEDILFSIKMRHLVGDLAHEDATQPVHYVPHRLFKIRKDLTYPEVEHPVLTSGNELRSANIIPTTIWHLAYIPNLWEIKKRYENHLLKSNMHTPKYLHDWYYSHLFGTYPKSQFNPMELPSVILKEFGIDKDELYFANRGLELKHFLDATVWKKFFKPKSFLEWGCGRGPRVFALRAVGCCGGGLEISDWAIENSLCAGDPTNIFVKKGDITIPCVPDGEAELVIAYDVLEHISYNKLNIAIDNLIRTTSKHILISIPYKGTLNCDNDPTHIIKEDRDWWVKKFTNKGLKEVEVPDHFLYKEQLLIFEK